MACGHRDRAADRVDDRSERRRTRRLNDPGPIIPLRWNHPEKAQQRGALPRERGARQRAERPVQRPRAERPVRYAPRGCARLGSYASRAGARSAWLEPSGNPMAARSLPARVHGVGHSSGRARGQGRATWPPCRVAAGRRRTAR
jgi:hypothetical protein